MIKLLPPGLHVLLGDSAGGIFTRVFFAKDRLLIDQDVLSVGPTPAVADLDAWNTLRNEFWTGFVPGNTGEHVHSRFNLVDNAQKLQEADRVNIWAGTGVSEQVFVAFVVHLMRLVGGDLARLYIVQLEMLNNKRVIGLGEFEELHFRNCPEPVPMHTDVAQHYLNAWGALSSPDPVELSNFARENPGANRWLKLAVQLMTRRFPDRRSGLTYWDHALLSRIAKRGPGVSQVIGFTMAETFGQGDVVGDWYLFGRLLKMSSASNPQPLIKLDGDMTAIRNTEAAITPFGEAVLKGEASNYPANPIDDWAGGVKLSSPDGVIWSNDGGKITKA